MIKVWRDPEKIPWCNTLMFYEKVLYDELTDTIFQTSCDAETGEIPKEWDYFDTIIQADRIAARIYNDMISPEELPKYIEKFEKCTPAPVIKSVYDFIISKFSGVVSPENIAIIIRQRQKYAEPAADRFRL